MASSTHNNSDSSLSFRTLVGFSEAAWVADATAPGDYLPVIDLRSNDPLPELPDKPPSPPAGMSAASRPPSLSVDSSPRAAGEIWLDGDVLMCACPDCRAPMSIRVWLMVADCWHCGTSIELSEDQEREAKRLLQQRDQQRRPPAAAPSQRPVAAASPTAPSRSAPSRSAPSRSAPSRSAPSRSAPCKTAAADVSPSQRPASSMPAAAPASAPARQDQAVPSTSPAPPAAERQRRLPTTAPRPQRRPASPTRQRLRQATARGVSAWISELFKQTPAWLVSLVFHLVLLTVLGMLTFPEEQEPYITLSAAVDRNAREGGDRVLLDPKDEVDFDLPIPDNVDLENEEQRQAVLRADQEARELRLDPDDPDINLPPLSNVKEQLQQGTRNALAARDPRLRVEMVQKEGGTTLTEAAVARGLRWLSQHQNEDGSWSLHGFGRAGRCSCGGHGAIRSDSAGTSLALLPFLGAGQSHLVGKYKESVSRGLRWLVDNQGRDGDLRAGSSGNSGMYAHGQGAIVLCEAFLLSGDEQLRAPAQKAIDFIVKAQHPGGGWRYSPGQAGDTSVVGWQVMALQSARSANLTVPEETFELASHYLDSVQSNDGALYGYQPRQRPKPTMTAEGLLCRMYLGWKKDDPGLVEGIDYLLKNHPPSLREANIYYWYYGTQAFHHMGDQRWDRWNLKMRDILVNAQEKQGHRAGSWPMLGPHASAGGRIYVTALAVCSLEVYYRHLPIFRQIDLD